MIRRLKAIARSNVKGVARWAAARLPLPRRPAILMYHRIGHESFDPWGLAVEEQVFEEQLDWIARNRTVLPLSEFARLHRAGSLNSDALSITFDDGYSMTINTAVPLLERYGVQATIFVSPDLVEAGREFWWDELARIVIGFPGEELRFRGSKIAVPQNHERDTVWPPSGAPATGRQKLFRLLHSKLRTAQPDEIQGSMAELRGQAPSEISDDIRPLTPGEIAALSSRAVEFGSHTLTHPHLPALDDASRTREICDSRQRCASLTGVAPASFAYPFGEYDRSCMRLVEKAGFVCAVTSNYGFVGRRSDVFALPRIRIGNWQSLHLRSFLAESAAAKNS